MDVQQVSAALTHGLACQRQGAYSEAASIFSSVLEAMPNHPRALHLLGLTMAAMGSHTQAKALLNKAIHADPDDITAISNLAKLELAQGELGFAIRTARTGISTRPSFAPLHCTEGGAYLALNQPMDALCAFERARMVDATSAEALRGIQAALSRLGHVCPPDAITFGIELLHHQGFYLTEGEQFYDAGAYQAAISCLRICKPQKEQIELARSLYTLALMHACEWAELQQTFGTLSGARKQYKNTSSIPPFALLALIDDPVAHLTRARKFFLPSIATPASRKPLAIRNISPLVGRRLKVAYLSADFHDHATSRLMVDMLEAHNRLHWEVTGVSFGPEEETPLRQRMKCAFERFLDVRGMSDYAVAQELKHLGMDIVVDVKGLTEGCREGIFLFRPAPVVVNFLAYPGSMGSKAYDYIIGDAVVTPFSHARHYDEHIVQLPGSYQCNGRNRPLPVLAPDKSAHGLPPTGFVFAAFNNTYKIQQVMFETWMRILSRVVGSVLWLTCDDPLTQVHLRQQASLKGVDGSRLIFASKRPWTEHLERLNCADVFLDTWPYNAHTTASDALWMGLPIITCKGQSFASRVAASLLTALGLPELVTENIELYEELAVRLAHNSEELSQTRQRLLVLRDSSSLFDAQRFATNIEQAFSCMVSRAQAGLPPQAFEIRDILDGGGYRALGDSAFSPVPKLL